MSKKVLKIKELSKHRYLELKHICLQYEEMKRKLNSLGGLRSSNLTDMPTAHSNSSKTEEAALKRLELRRKVEAIEQAAIETDSVYYKDILKGVTEEIPFKWINTRLCRTDYYERRRTFFAILDKKL